MIDIKEPQKGGGDVDFQPHPDAGNWTPEPLTDLDSEEPYIYKDLIDKEWTEEDIQKLSEIPTLSNPNWMPKSKKGNELVEYVLELFHNHIDIIMKIIIQLVVNC